MLHKHHDQFLPTVTKEFVALKLLPAVAMENL